MKQKSGNHGKAVKKERILQGIFLAVLLLYPLRHIAWGLDLWDTGYNYANFQYMGTEHMDSMWLFSTYLANAVGHLLTKLPFGATLVGMNFYTGLFVSLLAAAGYFFCTKRLGMKPLTAFLGEFIAVSFCWCPTALLYNYLTYTLFLGCVILLYRGLTEKKMGCLFGAGICLGLNVFVRFSNLPQAAMIVAVWAYAVMEGREEGRSAKEDGRQRKGVLRLPRGLRYTLWCLGGYLSALAVFGAYLHLRYGLDAYMAGIQRLFGMTENAADYKPRAMLMKLIGSYVENLYWVVRIGVIAAAGIILFALAALIAKKVAFVRQSRRLTAALTRGSRILWGLVSASMLLWLYYRGFCSFAFFSYDAILRPGILFLMLTMVIALVRIFHKNAAKEEKLISWMVLLVVFLTSIGSNNGVYPSMNNLFVAAPYTFWQSQRFFRYVKEYRPKGRFSFLVLQAFPVKGILAAFLAMFFFQVTLFGACFVFAEATGVQDVSARVENNEILTGVGMSPKKARWMEEITAYVQENHLQGQEVILYGNLPALSYYLQMPAAFNPWSDLRSYSIETLKADLEKTAEEARATDLYPVVIAESSFADRYPFMESGEGQAPSGTASDLKQTVEGDEAPEKWKEICSFMKKAGYKQTFSNEKFLLWERVSP